MVQCAAFGCNARPEKQTEKKGFFGFPKDESIRRKWILAVNSRRIIDGKVVDFTPSKYAKLCIKHFEDKCFVHPPSVMASAGFGMRLSLHPDAVPTLFPDTDNFKALQPKALKPDELGAPKRKRDTYGAFAKRNRKTVDEVLKLAESELSAESLVAETPASLDEPDLLTPSHCSKATQTTETVVFRPTENKGFNIKPDRKNKNVQAIANMVDSATEPALFDSEAEVEGHFEEEDTEDDIHDDDFDSSEKDPDWEPDYDSEEELMSDDEEEEEEVWNSNPEYPDRPYFVYESCLLPLLLMCSVCGDKCSITRKSVRGGQLKISTLCGTGHIRNWDSAPTVNGTPLINLLGAGAIFFSGVSIRQFLNCLDFLKVPFIKYRTFTRIQSSYILTAVDNIWKRTQKKMFQMCEGRSLRLGGDARHCSPGHTSKYGSYTLMDLETGHVLDVQLVQSNEVKNSNAMELEGLKRALSNLFNNGLNVSDLVTDRHVQVRKFMREEMGRVRHWFDAWHMAKGIKKKLMALGKKKTCELVGQWAQSIANHLYYCAASSAGNGDMVVARWMSIGNHVSDIHEGHGDLFPKCLHSPIQRNWIKKGSKAHKELLLVIGSKRLLSDIRMLSPAEQTSMLEAQHKVVCQFAPKFVCFSYAAMKQRLHLAALHSVSNAHRKHAETKNGEKRYRISYPKYKAGHHVVKPVKEACNYDYVTELMVELLQLKQQFKSTWIAKQASSSILFSPPPLASSAKKILKNEAVQLHRSRFN